MSILKQTLFATGFMAFGAVGTLGLSAVAGPHGDLERSGLEQGDAEQGDAERMERGGHGGAHGLKMLGRAMSRLDLTDDQQTALELAHDDIRARMDETKEGMQGEREELRQALLDGTLGRDDVKARVQTRMADAEETMLFAIDRVFDVYETLDDEQRTELADMLEQFSERRSSRSRRGRHGSHDNDAAE